MREAGFLDLSWTDVIFPHILQALAVEVGFINYRV